MRRRRAAAARRGISSEEHSGVVLAPMGEVDARCLDILARALESVFGCGVRVASARRVPAEGLEPRRGQHSAQVLLRALTRPEGERLLGIVDVDLYVQGLNFVFGLAEPLGRRALVALPRLRPTFYGEPSDDRLFVERVIKEAVHELGHTYGLEHCSDRQCVMAFSNSLADTDLKAATFCSLCTRRLRAGRP